MSEPEKKDPITVRAISVFVSVAALAVGIWVEVGSTIDAIRGELSHIYGRPAAAEEHASSHDAAAREWKDRIVQLEAALHDLELAVTRLVRIPGARPDAFTGRDGKRLEAQIRALEQLIGKHNGK